MLYPTWLRAIFLTLLAFTLSSVLVAPFSASTSSLFMTPEKSDFAITDFYSVVADGRDRCSMDTNIVIVNIDTCDRYAIGDLLDLVSACGAKAICLDATFPHEGEDDGRLLEQLGSATNLVQSINLVPSEKSDSFCIKSCSYFFHPDVKEYFASSGLPSKYTNSTVREFRTNYPTEGVGDIPSFVLALARSYSPEAARRLEERPSQLNLINFHSRRFRIIEPEEVAEYADAINGRVVMLGAITERGDLHPTPVDPLMPGVVIHAHALATVLDGEYMSPCPKWVEWAMGFVLCFMIQYLSLSLTTKFKGLLLRTLQVAFLYGMVQVGYYLFLMHNVIMDVSTAFVTLGFGFFAVDVWSGLKGLAEWAQEKRDAYRQRRAKTLANT